MEVPNGLYYFANAIPPDLEKEVLDYFEGQKTMFFSVSNKAGVSSEKGRKVCQYGYSYDYSSGNTTKTAPPIPLSVEKLKNLIPELLRCIPSNLSFDQCIVNKYLPGQGIGAHIDRLEYHDYICCFTLEGGAEIEFSRKDEKYTLYTEPRSLYIMSGESRYEWSHCMRPRLSDPGKGKRDTRTSVTFRTVHLLKKITKLEKMVIF